MSAAPDRLRLDKWLWHARFVKSRTLAAALAAGGRLRINGVAVAKAHALVAPGMVLTFPQAADIRVVQILALGAHRGPAQEARRLYLDLDPPQPRAADPAPVLRDSGNGHPTKRERRLLEALRRGG